MMETKNQFAEISDRKLVERNCEDFMSVSVVESERCKKLGKFYRKVSRAESECRRTIDS
jgi:hypothetical protein